MCGVALPSDSINSDCTATNWTVSWSPISNAIENRMYVHYTCLKRMILMVSHSCPVCTVIDTILLSEVDGFKIKYFSEKELKY